MVILAYVKTRLVESKFVMRYATVLHFIFFYMNVKCAAI